MKKASGIADKGQIAAHVAFLLLHLAIFHHKLNYMSCTSAQAL